MNEHTAENDAGLTMRQAAERIRALATAADPGPWVSYIEGRDHCGGDSIISTEDRDADLYVNVREVEQDERLYNHNWEANQDFIAAMHPLVALAFADWLDHAARSWDRATIGTFAGVWVEDEFASALKAARLILDQPELGPGCPCVTPPERTADV